jgi:hypothetical protein
VEAAVDVLQRLRIRAATAAMAGLMAAAAAAAVQARMPRRIQARVVMEPMGLLLLLLF